MNQYRCKTCKNYEDDDEKFACNIREEWIPTDVWNWIKVVGCTSHSDFQSEWSNLVRTILIETIDYIDAGYDSEQIQEIYEEKFEIKLRQSKDGEQMIDKTHSFCYKKYCEKRCICKPVYPPRCGFGCGMCNCPYCLDMQKDGDINASS